jgi:hypothetical protein
VTPAAAALGALLAGLAYLTLQPAPKAIPSAVPATVASPAASALVAEPALAQALAPEATKAPPAAVATQPKNRALYQRPAMPYRFMGKSTTGGETSIVLFGRGRVVTLRGPGPLDDEYVVEAVFDNYLVLRHVPTSVGNFLKFEQRQQVVGPPRDPEDSPRD